MQPSLLEALWCLVGTESAQAVLVERCSPLSRDAPLGAGSFYAGGVYIMRLAGRRNRAYLYCPRRSGLCSSLAGGQPAASDTLPRLVAGQRDVAIGRRVRLVVKAHPCQLLAHWRRACGPGAAVSSQRAVHGYSRGFAFTGAKQSGAQVRFRSLQSKLCPTSWRAI
jgi:hypothetical protein